MSNNLNLEEYQEFILDLMPRAGQIVRRYFHAEELPKRKKGKLDFVTAADLKSDEFIVSEINKYFPGIPVLTEERAEKEFRNLIKEELLWIVDPLDGTANFARGDANYSISIALVSYGKTLVGGIFVPANSRMFWARIDRAKALLNGRPIHVSEISSLAEATVCTDWSHVLSTRDATTDFLRRIFGEVRQIKILGSAATDLTLLSRGGVDIYTHVYLMPWDVAASSLIAQKAGAIITNSMGGEWNVFTPDILAGNPDLHHKMLKLLKE